MAIYLSFLVPKITAIVHATPTNARPTPHSVWNHEHDRVSDFVPIASLLEWQWRRIVMRNGQFYHSSRNGASRTAQCREIPHSFPEPFYQVLQARGVTAKPGLWTGLMDWTLDWTHGLDSGLDSWTHSLWPLCCCDHIFIHCTSIS